MSIISTIAGTFMRLGSALYTMVAPVLANGQVYPLRSNVNGELLVAATVVVTPPVVTAIHTDFTSGALGAGTSNNTFRTVPALTRSEILSVVCSYAGTVAGVTLQLRIGAVLVDLPIGVLLSGSAVRLLPPGMTILANAAETWQVQVVGATAGDTITVRAQFEETA